MTIKTTTQPLIMSAELFFNIHLICTLKAFALTVVAMISYNLGKLFRPLDIGKDIHITILEERVKELTEKLNELEDLIDIPREYSDDDDDEDSYYLYESSDDCSEDDVINNALRRIEASFCSTDDESYDESIDYLLVN